MNGIVPVSVSHGDNLVQHPGKRIERLHFRYIFFPWNLVYQFRNESLEWVKEQRCRGRRIIRIEQFIFIDLLVNVAVEESTDFEEHLPRLTACMYHLIKLLLLLLTRLTAALNNQVLIFLKNAIYDLPLGRHFRLILLNQPPKIKATVFCTGGTRFLTCAFQLKVTRLQKSVRVNEPSVSHLFLSSLDSTLHLVGIVVTEYDVVKKIHGNIWTHGDVAEAGRLTWAHEFLKLDLNANTCKIIELFHSYLIVFLVEGLVHPRMH